MPFFKKKKKADKEVDNVANDKDANPEAIENGKTPDAGEHNEDDGERDKAGEEKSNKDEGKQEEKQADKEVSGLAENGVS